MISPLRTVGVGVALLLTTQVAQVQPPAPARREQIALGATTAQRNEAARALVPLLKEVRQRAAGGLIVQPSTVPDSPFTGTQTTLFAFSISRRSVPVDARVVAAMDRLITWNINDPNAAETGRLFDQWLGELQVKNAGAVLMRGGPPCDVACLTRRMTTLDESWGASPKGRADARDELLLDALMAVVLRLPDAEGASRPRAGNAGVDTKKRKRTCRAAGLRRTRSRGRRRGCRDWTGIRCRRRRTRRLSASRTMGAQPLVGDQRCMPPAPPVRRAIVVGRRPSLRRAPASRRR